MIGGKFNFSVIFCVKRRKRKVKQKYPFLNGLLEMAKEKLISVIVLVFVSWCLGILTNHAHTTDIINKLQVENTDLSWAVDYFRK